MTVKEATEILKTVSADRLERKEQIEAEELQAAAAFATVAAAAAEAEALRFYFDEQPNGAYALRLANGKYVYQSHHDAGYQLAALDAMPIDRSSPSGSIFKRSWWWKQGKQPAGARPFNDSALFELKRVVGACCTSNPRSPPQTHQNALLWPFLRGGSTNQEGRCRDTGQGRRAHGQELHAQGPTQRDTRGESRRRDRDLS